MNRSVNTHAHTRTHTNTTQTDTKTPARYIELKQHIITPNNKKEERTGGGYLKHVLHREKLQDSLLNAIDHHRLKKRGGTTRLEPCPHQNGVTCAPPVNAQNRGANELDRKGTARKLRDTSENRGNKRQRPI